MKPIILFLVLLTGFSFGQIQELEKQLQKVTGKKRIVLIESISYQLENVNAGDAARWAKEGVQLSQSLNDLKKEQELSGWLAYLLRLNNEYDSAASYYDRALTIAADRKDIKAQAEYLNGMSQLERAQGQLNVAIVDAIEARKFSENVNDLKQLGESLYNIGYVHLIQHNYDSALLYFNKSLVVREKLADNNIIAISYNGIGLVHMRLSEYETSRAFYLQALSLIDSTQNPRLLAMIYNNVGITYEDVGEFEKGRDYYNRSIAIKKLVGDLRGLASTYGNLADNYRESGYPDEAIRYSDISKELSIQTRSLDYLITSYKLKALAYEQKKDYKQAYYNFQIFHQLEDSLFSTSKIKQVNDLLARYHAEKKQLENEKLKASAALYEITLSRQKYIIIGGAISFGIVLFVLNFMYTHYSRSKKLTTELTIQKIEAENINTQLSQVIEDNRNITNFMVHDLRSPMNKVSGFVNLIKKEGELKPTQELYISKVNEVVDQGRKLIDDLLTVNKPNDPEVKQFDCNNFLQDIIKQNVSIAEAKNISINYDLPDGSLIIESDQELLARALDNLFSNAIKFSPGGSIISVSLKGLNDSISISIADQGPGFTELDQKSLYQKFRRLSARPTHGEPSTGLGLAIAKNIVEQLKGTIALKTERGKGSAFTVTFKTKWA